MLAGLIATGVMIGKVNAPQPNDYQGELKPENIETSTSHVPEVRMPKTTYSREELQAELTAVVSKYGLNHDKFYCTIMRESTFNPLAVSPNGLCVGIAQYRIETWLGNCSKEDDRTDPYKALDCVGKMWAQGREYEWDAYCEQYYDEKCITLRGIYPVKKPCI